jgi:hypothetical protein
VRRSIARDGGDLHQPAEFTEDTAVHISDGRSAGVHDPPPGTQVDVGSRFPPQRITILQQGGEGACIGAVTQSGSPQDHVRKARVHRQPGHLPAMGGHRSLLVERAELPQ